MKNKPLISINITTYNRENLLKRCVNSVLKQTYKNIEVIIVDDFSTDNTENRIKKYQKKYPEKIKYFKHSKNLGLANARNTGIKKSTGEYIAFMDDDDEWIDSDKLRKQEKIFNSSIRNNLGIICSSVRLYQDKKKYIDKIIRKPKNLKKWLLKKNGIIYSPTVFTKKSIIKKVGGFDIKIKKGIDSDFYRKLILNFGYDIYFMKEITTAIYEYGNDRMTPNNNEKAIKNSIQSQTYTIKKYFKWFLIYPIALIYRIRIILKNYMQIIKLRIKK